MNEYPASRAEARASGEKHYFTGKPCKNGGIAKRLTSCGLCRCDACVASQKSSSASSPRKPIAEDQKEDRRRRSKEYHAKNRDIVLEKMRERNKLYYQKNKDRIKKKVLEYQAENASARTSYKKEWSKRRAKQDPTYKMTLVARRMLQRALGVSGQKKYKRTFDHLGYSSDELVSHLEKQFSKGMNWENYGEWHIDHIVPLAKLSSDGVTDPKVMNALSNLRPVWARENFFKGRSASYLI